MKKKQRLVLIIFSVVSIVCIILLVLGARYRNDQSSKITRLNNENVALIDRINKELALPKMKPIVLTVYDPADFNGNTFVDKLQKDDKVLLYINSNEAVIFRPSNDKIIDIVPARTFIKTKSTN